MQAKYIIFDDGKRVPVAQAFAYADANYAWAKYVEWADGGQSYAKAWLANIDAGYIQEFVRIGAGAYGDMTILSREPRKARNEAEALGITENYIRTQFLALKADEEGGRSRASSEKGGAE